MCLLIMLWGFIPMFYLCFNKHIEFLYEEFFLFFTLDIIDCLDLVNVC